MPHFKLEQLECHEIVKGYYPADAYFGMDGTVAFSARNPSKNPEPHMTLISRDGGRSFERTSTHMGRFIVLADGSCLSVRGGNQVMGKFDLKQKNIPYVGKIVRAKNVEAMLADEFEETFCLVDIPDLAVGYGDGNNVHTSSFDHGLVQLANGDILATMYGQFKQDKNRVPFIPGEYYQYRSWTVISRDNCRTFQYLSTIADCNTYPLPEYAEGYCEPDMIKLSDGSLYSALRSGGFYEGGDEHYTPTYGCRSTDGGKSWSAPNKINWHGVLPRLTQTQNGALIMTSGRDGQFIQVSGDLGETWDEPIYLTRNKGKWGRVPSGYAALGVVGENEIMLLYDDGCEDWYKDCPDAPNGTENKIYAVRYRVKEV